MIFLVYSDNKASIPLAASMVLILHRKYGKLHGAKAFFFTIFILLLFPTMLGTRELRDLACSVLYQEGEKRDPWLSGFPNFSDGLFKAQGSF